LVQLSASKERKEKGLLSVETYVRDWTVGWYWHRARGRWAVSGILPSAEVKSWQDAALAGHSWIAAIRSLNSVRTDLIFAHHSLLINVIECLGGAIFCNNVIIGFIKTWYH
jgi:hypothetical protein